MKATVGLYITYFNERELLTELIRSAISEWDRPDEIIVYDDCSSFPAQDFVPSNEAIKIIRGDENRGFAFGRNRLLEQASTDYVHFHDSDDFFLPGWLHRIRRVIKDDNWPDAVFTEIAAFINGEMLPWQLDLDRLTRGADLLGFCIEKAMYSQAGTFSRKLLLSMGGYPETLLHPEMVFHTRLATRCSSYSLITEPLVGIRIRSNSYVRGLRRLDVYRDNLRALKQVASEIPANYHTQLADAAITMSRRLYQQGQLEEAREGFSWATNLSRPSYQHEQWGYRLCARIMGPFYAELVGAIFRKLPKRTREAVR